MFIGRPPGNYYRLLDFSTALTGCLFFVPSATFLDSVSADPATDDESLPVQMESESPNSSLSLHDGSLGIGSLKGDIPHE